MVHDCASCVHNSICCLKDEKSKLESVVSERFKGFSGEHFRINVNCNHFQGMPRLCQSDINLCSVNAATAPNLKATARTQYERDCEQALRDRESGLLNAATADLIMGGAAACMSLSDMYKPNESGRL